MKYKLLLLLLGLIMLCSFVSFSQYTPDVNTVALWHFDEGSGTTISDMSGNGNHGILSNSTAWFSDGKFGNCILFDGTNTYIAIPHQSNQVPSGSFTIEVWIKTTAYPTAGATILNKGIGNDGRHETYGFYMFSDGRIRFYSENGPCGGGVVISSFVLDCNTPIELNAWTHIAGVYDATTDSARVYINGEQNNVIYISPHHVPQTCDKPISIGADSLNGGGYVTFFNGYIDEVRISNIARTVEQFNLFSFNTTSSLTPRSESSAAWGDYDNDGDLDLLISGRYGSAYHPSHLYRNDNGVLIESGLTLPGVGGSAVSWGDYDNDGLLDFILLGYDGSGPLTKIYHNTGSTFVESGIILQQLYFGTPLFVDYDNDGDEDLFINGINSGTRYSFLYKNTHSNYAEVNSGIHGLANATSQGVRFVDYDKDGDLDLFISGDDGPTRYITKFYQNADGTFTEVSLGLVGVDQSAMDFADYDQDGDVDLLLMGSTGNSSQGYPSVVKVYRNDAGTFVDINASLTTSGGQGSTAKWGDYDNDGDPDILLAGFDGSTSRTRLYNNDAGTFNLQTHSFDQIYVGDLSWGDYDNDTDLDLALTGNVFASGDRGKLFDNNFGNVNTPPTSPTNLSSTIQGNTVILRWSPSSDNQTTSSGLSYNIRIGTTSGGVEIISPLSDISTGYRRVPRIGNVNSDTFWVIKNLPPDIYYWSVQAIDNSFAGSAFSTEESFGLGIYVSVDSLQKFINDTVLIPVRTNFISGNSYSSAQINFSDYQTGLDFLGVDTNGTLAGAAGWQIQTNETSSLLLTASAGANEVSGNGVLFKLKFKVIGEICSFVPLTIDTAYFDTGTDPVIRTNGGVYIKPIPVYGDADGNGSIQPFDAAVILDSLVYDSTFTCQTRANADATGNGTITALDASVILMKCVQRIPSLPYDTTEFGTLRASGNISMSNINTINNQIKIPLTLSDGNNILSFEGSVTYNSEDLNFDTIAWSENLHGFNIPTKVESGRITFAGADSLPDGATGVFATLVFSIIHSFEQTTVSLERLRWNEEEKQNSASIIIRPFSISSPVIPDWNMISVPLSSTDLRKTFIYPTATSNAFYYQRGYAVQETLRAGVGYWLKFSSNLNISYSGFELQQLSINVKAGWNMIGSISTSVDVSTISSNPPGLVTSQFFGYSGGYSQSETIEPGRAYWVKVNQDGVLILSSITNSSANIIRIVSTSELPPSPPDGEVSNLESEIPNQFSLQQNFPNPFNPSTVIRYQLPVTSFVTVQVFNTLGQEVALLVNEVQEAGYKSVEWNADGLPSGVYVYKLSAGTFVNVKKMLLMR